MIFVDTGAFLARHVLRDPYHRRARAAWRRLEREGERCLTTQHVIDETVTLLARQAGYPFAAARARSLLASKLLTIERPGAAEEWSALDLFEKYADQRVSFTDCLSFVVMKERRLRRVFTFDAHFRLAGFEAWPAG